MTLLDEIAHARTALQTLEHRIRQDPSAADLQAQRDDVIDKLAELRAQLTDAPSAQWPVLMVPLRLETRYAWQQPADPDRHSIFRPPDPVATPVLLVRIYPDDISIDQHDPALTRQEISWLRDYIERVSTGSGRIDFVNAWEQLVARAGPTRAAWIVANRPPMEPLEGATLRRPARAGLLPDHFVTLADVQGQQLTAKGSTVREPLDVTPDPLRSADGLRWMVDFEEARAAGLAIVVALPPTDGGPPTVDRLIVVGVDASRDASGASVAFEELLNSHHYTTGLSFIRPGAATNATPNQRPDRTTAPDIQHVFDVEGDMTPLTLPTTLVDDPPSDGLEAGALLGVNPLVFGHVEGADGRLRQAGRDIRQLIAAAWLEPLYHLLGPMVPADDLSRAAEFYVQAVDALGPLPVLRIGSQPYGLLPVSVLATEHADLTEGERRILGALGSLRWVIWNRAADVLPRIGGSDDPTRVGSTADPTQILLRLLRQDGAVAAVAVRPALGPEASYAFQNLINYSTGDRAAIADLIATFTSNPDHPPIAEFMFTEPVPIVLPMVGLSPESYLDLLSLYLPLATTLLEIAEGGPERPAAVLHALARLALLNSADRACRNWLGWKTVGRWAEEHDDGTTPFYKLVDRLNAVLPPNSGSPPLHVLLTGSAPPAGCEQFLAVRGAIRSLALPPANRPGRSIRHPPELLDVVLRAELGAVSNRLDAWYTALATNRLRRQRALPAQNTGLVLGAYGVLLDIKPAAAATAVEPASLPADISGDVVRTSSNGGYVHAPSIAHAVTAAVLRSAHLAHWRLDVGVGKDAFSVDLSSRRVRTALHLMDGIREGQPLSALLGYRIERRLRAEAPAGVAVVRRAAPLVAGKLTTGTTTDVAADNVVDALALLELVGEPTPASVTTALTPHRGGVTAADWQPVLAAAVAAITDARDALDAVADVLVAEGVFQLVSGNPSRSAGSVDAIAAAGSPPPRPAVVETRRRGTAVVHRAIVALPAGGTPTEDPEGWAVTPRAELEPALEIWARSVLPSPQPLSPTRMAALDVVAASRAQLEGRIIALGGDLTGVDELSEAAATLRALLSGARALSSADIAAPDSPIPTDASGAALRLDGFAEAMADARAALDATIQAGDPELLRVALLDADLVGTSQPVPASLDLLELIPAAVTARDELAARLAVHDPQADVDARIDTLSGGNAWVLPSLTPTQPWPWPWPGPAGATPAEIRRHLIRSATVRPGVARLDRVLGVVEALTATVPVLTVIQQPHEPQERWVAIGDGPVKGGRTATLLHLPQPVTDALVGLVIDEWTEVVPDATATTSMAFHYDAPSSAPPNVALLGVAPPGVELWTTESLFDVVAEALELGQLRAVDTDWLAAAGPLLPPLISRENPIRGVSADIDIPTLTEPS